MPTEVQIGAEVSLHCLCECVCVRVFLAGTVAECGTMLMQIIAYLSWQRLREKGKEGKLKPTSACRMETKMQSALKELV